jgi:hypothetical protein
VAVIRSGRSVENSQFCLAPNITATKYNILFITITNFLLLALILTGLLRWNRRQKGDMWHLFSARVNISWMHLLRLYEDLWLTAGCAMGYCFDCCRDTPTGMFIEVGGVHLLMFSLQVLIYLNLNGVYHFGFPTKILCSRRSWFPRCNGYSAYFCKNVFMELTPDRIKMIQIPARETSCWKYFLAAVFMIFAFFIIQSQ